MNAVPAASAPASRVCQSTLLADASNVAAMLEKEGTTIFSTFNNGRTMVFIIDQPPAFVRGGMKWRVPNGNGYDRVMAAPFHGMQLEWRTAESAEESGVLLS